MITKLSAKPTQDPSEYDIIKLEILHFRIASCFPLYKLNLR